MFFFGFNIIFIKRIGQFINHIITLFFFDFMLIYPDISINLIQHLINI